MISRIIKTSLFTCLLLSTIVFSGCKKVEGTGGAATIEGKVMLQDYTTANIANGAPYDGYNVKVYLIYGSGTTYSDVFSTSYDGSYRFENLRSGNYKVFVYSAIVPAPSNPPKDETITEAVTISDKKGIVTVPTITVKKY